MKALFGGRVHGLDTLVRALAAIGGIKDSSSREPPMDELTKGSVKKTSNIL